MARVATLRATLGGGLEEAQGDCTEPAPLFIGLPIERGEVRTPGQVRYRNFTKLLRRVTTDWGLGIRSVTRSKFHGTFLRGLTHTHTRAIKHPRVTLCHTVSPCVGHVQVALLGHEMSRFAQIGGMCPAWSACVHRCMDMGEDVHVCPRCGLVIVKMTRRLLI